MLNIKFYKHGNGYCESCGGGPSELFLATVSLGEKSKDYIVCKNCAIKIKKQVEKKNEMIVSKSPKAETICGACCDKKNVNIKTPGACNLPIGKATGTTNENSTQNINAYYINNDDNPIYHSENKYNNSSRQEVSTTLPDFGASASSKMKLSFLNDNLKKEATTEQIGGWLVFFCIGQAISSIYSFVNCFGVNSIVAINIIFSLIYIFFAFMIVKNIFCKRKSFIKFFDLQTLIVIVINILSGIISKNTGSLVGALLIVGANILYYAVWLEYFIKSQRCKQYFGSDNYIMEGFISKFFFKK